MLSIVDFELLTIVESQILRAYEIHPWYKNLGLSRLSSYRQSLKMTFYCQLDLTNGKMPQNWRLNNLNKLLNPARLWRLVLLCKTHRFPIFRYCTFLYRSILGVSCFHLCFIYLQKFKAITHQFNQSINTRSILTDRPVNLTPPCLATDMVFRSAIAERKRQLVDFSY